MVHALERLTRREREILNALFSLENCASAEQIRLRLTNPPSDSSVRVMLARLENKGLVEHDQDGPRYLYSATIPQAAAKQAALQEYVETFFAGSTKQMAVALLTEGPWSDDDLSALRSVVDRVRKDRKTKAGST